MKTQNLFSGRNKKNISKFCLLKFLPRMHEGTFRIAADSIQNIFVYFSEEIGLDISCYLSLEMSSLKHPAKV